MAPSRSFFRAIRFVFVASVLAPVLAACGSNGLAGGTGVNRAAFTSAEFGVDVSPRMTTASNPPRGGGRAMIGQPYTVRGRQFVPAADPDYSATGHASWYGADFHGRMTANGEIFSRNAISGAHPTLPLPSYVRVTNVANGRSLLVRINDRGPFLAGRVVDLSERAAELLGYRQAGTAEVRVDYVSAAPLEGDDTRFLVASLNTPTGIETGDPNFRMDNAIGRTSVTDAIGNTFGSLFGYADSSEIVSSAHLAAEAVATRAPGLEDWRMATDADARSLSWQLGTFIDPGRAGDVERAFAVLGAVEYEELTVNAQPAIRLTLSELKPGAVREDALRLAQELGLNPIILY